MRVRNHMRAVAMLAAPLWLAAIATTPAWAAEGKPEIHVSAFPNPPQSLQYFEDSDVILFHDREESVIYRSADAGTSWDKVTAIPASQAFQLIMHDFDPTRAFVLTLSTVHYRTEDHGKTWQSFDTGAMVDFYRPNPINFHAGDPDRIIFNGVQQDIMGEARVSKYTLDGFRTEPRFLRGNTQSCWWAKSTEIFTTGDRDLDASRVLCVVKDSFSANRHDQRLVISDKFFEAAVPNGDVQESEPNLDSNRPVQGVANIAAVSKYLLAATTSENTGEMALFVTDDTLRWHRAVFPNDHAIVQEAYTVLESTNYSIQIDVMTSRPSSPMGVLMTSNSNGTYFTRNIEYTNRDYDGHVDFEKISGIQGIFLVNHVENGVAVEDANEKKKIVTDITFDDGRTFSPVYLNGDDKQHLHLHSVTELSNLGRVYSSPAPGLVMAIGNTGESLESYKNGNLYVSDDAGVTWIEGPTGPHKYEFGDQGSILVAVRDADDVGEIKYSLDHGKTWQVEELGDGLLMKPYILTTTQDSTSLKFLLIGESKDRWNIVALDFEGLHEATCKESDLEDWWARVDEKGEPTCLMGHKQKYRRRKKDAACFLKQEFLDPVVETTDCDCTDQDFECDYNFRRDENRECVPAGPIAVPEGACGPGSKPEETFQGSSGWRLIPGNTCHRVGDKQKDAPVERKCADSVLAPPPPPSGKVQSKLFDFELKNFNDFEKHYLERGDTSEGNGETIIMRPIDRKLQQGGPVFVTDDHGKTWTRPEVFADVDIWAILTHDYFKEIVFFITKTTRVIYTVDHGQHWHEFKAPAPPDVESERAPLSFHPDKMNWLIWTGKKCEQTGSCYNAAWYSKDRGDTWTMLLRNAERCEFIGSSAYAFRKQEEVLCLAHATEEASKDAPVQLISSNDFFQDNKIVQEENAKGFATMAEFIVVAAENSEKKSLRALASLDGEKYAEAHFPANFKIPDQHEYTVLDSSTHAVNLFVATETTLDLRYGTIIKSNSNGTSYVMSITGVNCDNRYYVDFEKVQGLEGVLLVNTVANRDEKNPKKKQTAKKLQTKISHNDGAEWAFLPPPAKDLDGKAYGCKASKGASDGGDPKCALHIHGYTEREDHHKTYSSEGAVGIMFGVGNVGESLGPISEADTFMTSDAGLTWRNVKHGVWMWQFGDQGSIIVLVQKRGKTKTVSYTIDEGATWEDYAFSDVEVEVLDMTTLRSGASRNFLLWCRSGDAGHVFTINLDFSGLTDRPCEYDEKDSEKSDYYPWSPKHPLLADSQCLFGHKSQYLRKKTDRTCFNGYRLQHSYNVENCTCGRQDYECDYNYELDNHGQCALVSGLEPMSKSEWCANHPDDVDYYPPTGFRRIPLTTCEGGDEFDKVTKPQSCDNKEDEFERIHRGPGGVAIFFAVVIPVGVAAAVGWYVYRNWTGKLGAIRLGENGTSRFALDSDAPWIKYPVMGLAGVVAVVSTVPLIVTALFRTTATAIGRWTGRGGGGYSAVGNGNGNSSGGGGWGRFRFGLGGTRRFTTRDSFARRGEYAIVDDDEGELLGDDSDEEV